MLYDTEDYFSFSDDAAWSMCSDYKIHQDSYISLTDLIQADDAVVCKLAGKCVCGI